MKKLILLMILLLPLSAAFSQTAPGAIKLVVTEKGNGLPIPFANVVLFDTLHKMITGSQTDFDGKADIRPIPEGVYDVAVTSVGFLELKIKGVVIESGQTTSIPSSSTQMIVSTIQLNEVTISYSRPILSQDKVSTSNVIVSRSLHKMPARSPAEMASMVNGVHSTDHGVTRLTVRGARAESNFNSVNSSRSLKKEDDHIVKPSERNVFELQRESYELYSENSFENAKSVPLSTFSIDVDNGSYTNARRIINSGYLPPMASVRTEEFINYFPYNRIDKQDEHPFIADTELGICPWDSSHQLLRVTLQADELDMCGAPTNNLVFLIDVSGSMSSEDKLGLVQRAFRLLVNQMNDQDRISIVTYAGRSAVLLEGEKANKKEKILEAIDQLVAGGSTNGSEGITTAYALAEAHFVKGGNNRVILATDGDFNVGISDKSTLIKLIETKRESGVYLSTLGFGSGNYMDDRMEQLADHGNGSYMYIDSYQEARKVFLKDITSNLVTVAKDVKFQIEFNPKKVQSYRLLGYENRVLADKDFADDTKDAGELGAGQMVTAFYEIIPVGVNSEQEDSLAITKRYQESTTTALADSDEMIFLKIRYKLPGESKSILIEQPVAIEQTEAGELSESFVFGSAVVEFSLILRESKYKGKASLSHTKQSISNALSFDPEGYRRSFLTLVEMTEEMYDTASR